MLTQGPRVSREGPTARFTSLSRFSAGREGPGQSRPVSDPWLERSIHGTKRGVEVVGPLRREGRIVANPGEGSGERHAVSRLVGIRALRQLLLSALGCSLVVGESVALGH
mmetsp:Transcript_11586/g.27528  ORF Transcript_11586/g.27528 Transcript_11586/m.27528 type:complete len:110 (-) Transcript_11586:157-486(-)